jgi:hypothetical protein
MPPAVSLRLNQSQIWCRLPEFMIYYLIFIGLFVAVLVFISSRIRGVANRAFEPETIENAEFKISKPAGFLHPLNNGSEFPFEAYSRELGEKGAGRSRKSLVKMSVYDGLNFKDACQTAKKSADNVYSEMTPDNVPKGQKICLIEGEKMEDEINRLIFHKIVESKNQNKTYDLEVMIIEANEDEYIGKASEFINSFTVK